MPRKSPWNGPTKAIRVPEHCAEDLLAIARLLDAPAEDWNESVGLLPQVAQRLAIFHGLIESSVRALKRIKEPSLFVYPQGNSNRRRPGPISIPAIDPRHDQPQGLEWGLK